MESLYSTIEIVKKLSDKKEKINYFLLNNRNYYGIKITRTFSDKMVEENEVVVREVSKDKKRVIDLIDSLMDNGNDFTQIQYVIEDYASSVQL